MIRTIKFLPAILAILFLSGYAAAQNTPAQLAVVRETETNADSLLKTLSRTGADTSRVNILIKTAHVYWHQRTTSNHGVDSTAYCAGQAYSLSQKLHFAAGRIEAAFLLCKVYTNRNTLDPAIKLTRQFDGEQKAKLLLAIAEHFVFDFESNTASFQRALPLIAAARSTAAAVHSERWLDECRILTGKYEFKQGNLEKGRAAFMEIISTAHLSKDYAREADAWSSLGNRMPQDDSTFRTIIHDQEQAVKYYLLAGKKKDAAYSLRDLAIVNGNYTATDSAEHQLLRCVTLLRSINEKISIRTYTILADFYRLNGDYHKALYYAFEALKVTGDTEEKKMETYLVLARVYQLLRSYPSSLKYYQIVFNHSREKNDDYQYILACDIANVQAAGGNPEKAISFLTSFVRNHPAPRYNFRQITACTFADIYNQMGNYQKAEQYYLEMLSYNAAVKAENRRTLDKINETLAGTGSFYKIGKFYTERKNFKKGKAYLTLSLTDHQYMDAQQILDTDHLLFKADSALGNYIAAIRHFQKHQALTDSVNSVIKNRQITELNIKYETAQREKDFKALQNAQLIQKAKLTQTELIRNIILICAAVLLFLALLAYNGYRNKQKANKKITALLSEKDQFIKEKDWLLKEIHHRVKNNLQIVMSLLSTQSAYLQNEDAVEAILESENRVQSIALIHQKLYSTENLASISMPDYVSDLIHQLSDAFDTSARHIRFRQQIESISIDLSQAVPLGLILNEAITNAIKYAFDASGGEINITFKRTSQDTVKLTVDDNGRGLPPGFELQKANSLGMELMQGLSGQLRGSFQICTCSGTSVQVEFRQMSILLKTADTAYSNA